MRQFFPIPFLHPREKVEENLETFCEVDNLHFLQYLDGSEHQTMILLCKETARDITRDCAARGQVRPSNSWLSFTEL